MRINKTLQKSGWWIVFFLSIVPLALWIFETPIAQRLGNLPLLARGLGDVAGLCGMAMFSLVIVMSARLKFLERFFRGINDAYTAHHFFGGTAFCLLLMHPLFLVYGAVLISLRTAVLFLMPDFSSAFAVAHTFGTAGLFVMIIALIITFYTKIKYQVWRFTHKFLGLAFAFAFLHVFLIGADLSSNYVLKSYLLVLAVLGISAYIYRTLLINYLVKVFEYSIKDIKQYPDKIWEIELKPVGKKMNFRAGQFGFVKFYSKELTKESHPFSFSSAPGTPLKIAVKELGDYTNKLGGLKPGDLIDVEGPFGVFDFRQHENRSQIWIAGGIGIAPFLGMLRSMGQEDAGYKVDLCYSVKDENILAFQEEIANIAEKNNNLNINFWITKTMGFLTVGGIKLKTPDFANRDILICGPAIMMDAMEKQFLSEGVPKNQIYIERFQLY